MLTLNADQVAMLAAAADAPESSEARQQFAAALGDFTPIPGRHWTQFPIRSVVAFLLWTANHQNSAIEAAIRAVAAGGLDDLVRKVFEEARALFYDTAMQALHHRRPDMARMFLASMMKGFAGVFDFAPERSLLELIGFAETAIRPPMPRTPPTGRPTVVSLCVWGEHFIKAAARTYLPCCLASGNFPKLKEYGTIYLRIRTRSEDMDLIRSLPVVQEIARHAELEIEPLPPALLAGTHLAGKGPWNRILFAASQYCDVMFARSLGADLMIGVADQLVSNRCFTAAKQRLADGVDAVVVQWSRVTADALRLLDEQHCRHGTSFDIPSDVLYRVSLQAMHPFILQSFMRTAPSLLPQDPVHLYFRMPGGFSHRSSQLNAFAVATRRLPADLTCDYHSADTRLLSDVLAGQDRNKACHIEHGLPDDMYTVSVDDEKGVVGFGMFELSPASAAKSILKWANRLDDIDHFQWAIRQRFEYPLPEGVAVDLPRDCRDEEEAVAEIVALVEQRRAETLERLKGYQDHGTGD